MASELDPALDALRQEFGVRQLVDAVALSDSFQFHLVTCAGPRTSRKLLRLLEVEVPRERGEPMRFVRLDPYESRGAEAMTFTELGAKVLGPLVTPAPADTVVGVACFVDLTTARSGDEPAFVELFQRMNEQRNAIAKARHGPLVLCAPRLVHALFEVDAPDFWSIRSAAIEVVDAPPSSVPLDRGGAGQAPAAAATPHVAIEEHEARLEALHRLGDDPKVRQALAAELKHAASELAKGGAPMEARAKVEEVAAIERELFLAHPSVDRAEDLFRGLVWLAELRAAQGDLDGALEIRAEARALARAQLEKHPEHVVWQRALGLVARAAGNALVLRGCFDEAGEAYAEGASDLRAAVLRAPERTDYRRDLADVLVRWGHALRSRGAVAEATSVYAEALDTLGASPTPAPLELAAMYADVARGLAALGDARAALRALDSAIAIGAGRASSESAPARSMAVWLVNRAIVLVGLGDVAGARASVERAVAAWGRGASGQLDESARAAYERALSSLADAAAIDQHGSEVKLDAEAALAALSKKEPTA